MYADHLNLTDYFTLVDVRNIIGEKPRGWKVDTENGKVRLTTPLGSVSECKILKRGGHDVVSRKAFAKAAR